MTEHPRTSPETIISRYIIGKDSNRPAEFDRTFTIDARAHMDSTSDVVSFPDEMIGRDVITEYLASDFARHYENVHTFCLCAPPDRALKRFSCPWLVAMSVKEDHSVRVGWGVYDWTFDVCGSGLCSDLRIQIIEMLALPPELAIATTQWVRQLPYPWVSPQNLSTFMPADNRLAPVNVWLATLDPGATLKGK